MIIDPNRLNRNHVHNVRYKKDKDTFYVVVKIAKEKDVFVEVEWNKWLKMDDRDKQDL